MQRGGELTKCKHYIILWSKLVNKVCEWIINDAFEKKEACIITKKKSWKASKSVKIEKPFIGNGKATYRFLERYVWTYTINSFENRFIVYSAKRRSILVCRGFCSLQTIGARRQRPKSSFWLATSLAPSRWTLEKLVVVGWTERTHTAVKIVPKVHT